MTNMLSSIIVRYASRKSFSLPKINFQYAQQESEEVKERILSPLLPVNNKSEPVGKRGSKHKQRITKKSLDADVENNITKFHFPSSKGDISNREQYRLQEKLYSRKAENAKKFSKHYNELQKSKRLKLEGKYKDFSTSKFNPAGEIIFGIHPVLHALQAQQRKFHCLYYKTGLETTNNKIQEILDIARQHSLLTQAVEASLLDSYVGGDRVHQGICGDVSPLSFQILDSESLFQETSCKSNSLDDTRPGKSQYEREVDEKPYKLWLYMDRIQDPMNFGAILRSAYFMGVDKVLASKENSCRLSGVVSKASAGAAELLPVYQVDDIKLLFNRLTSHGWHLVSTAAKGAVPSVSLEEYEPVGNIVLAVGNEGLGISQDLQDMFKTTLTIQPGRNLQSGMDSLNVSVATAVILHSVTAKLFLLNKKKISDR